MALIRVTEHNAHEFAYALGILDYIKTNYGRNITYEKSCPLYTDEFIDNTLSVEALCNKNCKTRNLCNGSSPRTDKFLNCCTAFRLSELIEGKSSILYLCDTILDKEVDDI